MREDTEVAMATFGRARLRLENPEYAMLPPAMPDDYLKASFNGKQHSLTLKGFQQTCSQTPNRVYLFTTRTSHTDFTLLLQRGCACGLGTRPRRLDSR